MLDQADDEQSVGAPFGLDRYSEVLYNLRNEQSSPEPVPKGKRSTICQAFVKVKLPSNGSKTLKHTMCAVKLDICSSANLCSETLLHDVKPCAQHGMPPIRMKMAKGKTPWFEKCGKLRAHDEHGRPFDEIYYAMTDPIHGERRVHPHWSELSS